MATSLKEVLGSPEGGLEVRDAVTAFANLGATQTVVWYDARQMGIVIVEVTDNTGGVLTVYKTMNPAPVDGTVGTALTHDTYTNTTGASTIIGPGWMIGLAWVRTSGNVTARIAGEF